MFSLYPICVWKKPQGRFTDCLLWAWQKAQEETEGITIQREKKPVFEEVWGERARSQMSGQTYLSDARGPQKKETATWKKVGSSLRRYQPDMLRKGQQEVILINWGGVKRGGRKLGGQGDQKWFGTCCRHEYSQRISNKFIRDCGAACWLCWS